MNEKHKRLQQTLLENGESLNEAESLSALSSVLDAMPIPHSNSSHQANLLNLLTAEMPAPKTKLMHLKEWYPIALLLSQVRVIQREIWFASAGVLILGVIVTLIAPNPDWVIFTLVTPLVAAVGVAMLYDHDVRMMLEIEETTLASARLLLLARLTLVYGFNLIVALIGSVILALLNADISLIPLIASWLAPMTFLSGLAFWLGIILNDTLAASIFSLFIWMMHVLGIGQTIENPLFYLLSLPGLSDPSNRPFLMFTAALLIAVSLWIIGIQERTIGHSA